MLASVCSLEPGRVAQVLVDESPCRTSPVLALEVVAAHVASHAAIGGHLLAEHLLAIFEPLVTILDGVILEGVAERAAEARLEGHPVPPGLWLLLDLQRGMAVKTADKNTTRLVV